MRRTIIALTYGLEGYTLLLAALLLLRPEFTPRHHAIATAMYAVFFVVLLFLLAAYVITVVRNRGLTAFEKTGWIVALLICWPVVFTMYWREHMARET